MDTPPLLVRTARLPPLPESAPTARRLVRETLKSVEEPAAVFAAEVAVSELVTNAILHAATEVELRIEVTSQAITVEVRDWNPALPAQRRASANATTGRGLALVSSLTDANGFEPHPPAGKTAWFRLYRGN